MSASRVTTSLLSYALALSPIHAARTQRHGVIEVRRRRQSERPAGAPAAPLTPSLYEVLSNGRPQIYGEYSEVMELLAGLGRLTWEPVYEQQPDETDKTDGRIGGSL